jgi:type I restriction enzyme S subunit
MTELPKSWSVVALEELFELVLGGDWGKDPAEALENSSLVRCIRAAELSEWDAGLGESAATRRLKNSSVEKRRLRSGDILVEVSGGGPDQPVGRAVLITPSVLSKDKSHDFVCTNFFRFCRPVSHIDSAYLSLYLRHFYSIGGTEALQGGSNNLRNLRFPDYVAQRVPVAPLKEQHRIVAKIEELFSELDKGVESLTSAREQLKAYRQSVLKAAFEGKLSADWRSEQPGGLGRLWTENYSAIAAEEAGDLPNLPEGWRYVRLGDFIAEIEAGKSFRCDERVPNADEIGVAKVSAVTWGEYDEDESKTCIDADKINPGYLIREGDFLFSRANTIELVGACVIAKRVTRAVMLSDKTLRIVFAKIDPRYILHYLRSRLGRKEIMRRSTGNQESMRNIGQERIKSIILPVCPPGEAEWIVNRIQDALSSVDKVESEIESELQRAAALRQSILKRAFSGQLVAQDTADEPATVLLERIRTERKGSGETNRRNNKNSKKEAA